MPGTADAKKEGSVEDSSYSESYSRHLESRLRALETEKQILHAERTRLEKETQTLRTELEKLRQSPLITATIVEMLEDNIPKFPFLALLVSGGHTLLVDVSGIGRYKIIGESLDDAVGMEVRRTTRLQRRQLPKWKPSSDGTNT